MKVHCEYPQFHIQNDDTNDVMISSMKEIGINIFSDDKFLVYKCLFLANNFRLFIAPSKLLIPDLSNDSIEWLPEQYGSGDEFGIFKPITDNFDITMQIWMSPFERHYVINIVYICLFFFFFILYITLIGYKSNPRLFQFLRI